MAEDHFEAAGPQLNISEKSIEVEAVAGDPVSGSFFIDSSNGVPFRGVCYSSNPYIRLLTPQFEGISAKVDFEVIHQGFLDRDELSGEFSIIAEGIELTIPVHIRYSHRYPSSSVGFIDSDEQFARLCKEHWNEAMQLFYSDRILAFIYSLSVDRQLLYRGYAGGVPKASNLEAYLIASGSKEPVIFSIDETDRNYYSLRENHRQTIEITRSNWGYISIDVSSDADFVTVEKERISADFFMGSHMQLSFYVHANRLHAGKNYARITLSSDHCQQEINIMATSRDEDEDYIPASRVRGRRLIRLLKCYENYRFEKLSSQEWASESTAIIDDIIRDEDKDTDTVFYRLMKAHAHIVGGDKQEALWIIQELRRDIEDRKSTNWAYLLYLCTLIEKDESYVNRLVKEIELIFREDSDNPVIFWFLLFLREEYIDNYKLRLSDIRSFMLDGEDSVFFYIEADYLYTREPFLLTAFERFSLRIIDWMCRKGRITPALGVQVSYVLAGERVWDDRVYNTVKRVYDAVPSDEFLSNMVTWLLRCHKFGEEYLPWYDKAINRQMNFTGLYEAYVLSLSSDYSGRLPDMVIMYFRYQNTLPPEKKAFVYANVIIHQKNSIRIYEQYIRHMEEFALDMVRKHRIDDNLAIIYQHVFLERGIVDDDVADNLGQILFCDKVFGLDSDIVRVLVYQEQLKDPVIAAVEEHKAYVSVFSRNYRIFLEDRNGRLHCDPSEYYVEHMMQPGKVYRRLYEMASSRLYYFLYDLNHRSFNEDFLAVDSPDIVEFLQSGEVYDRYRRQLYPSILRFMSTHEGLPAIEEHFLSQDSLDGLDRQTIAYIVNLHIMRGEYKEAYQLIYSHNAGQVEGKSLLALCSDRIREEPDRADDFLLGIISGLMKRFLTSEETITYLNRFFIGPTEDMLILWQFASARDLETRALEERIITQMLYTENIGDSSEQVFGAYQAHHPNRMLRDAYLTYFSRKYLWGDESVPGRIFSDTLVLVRQGDPVNDSMRLALIRNLSGKNPIREDEYNTLDELLGLYIPGGTYMSFFKDMDRRLIVKYHLYDKTLIEYRGKENLRLSIVCSFNEEAEETLELPEMYPGIYVRAFVLFFGDVLRYRVIDAASDGEVLKEEELTFTDMLDESGQSRYERINAMQSASLYSNDKKLLEGMKEYQGLLTVTEKLFSML